MVPQSPKTSPISSILGVWRPSSCTTPSHFPWTLVLRSFNLHLTTSLWGYLFLAYSSLTNDRPSTRGTVSFSVFIRRSYSVDRARPCSRRPFGLARARRHRILPLSTRIPHLSEEGNIYNPLTCQRYILVVKYWLDTRELGIPQSPANSPRNYPVPPQIVIATKRHLLGRGDPSSWFIAGSPQGAVRCVAQGE